MTAQYVRISLETNRVTTHLEKSGNCKAVREN